MTSTQRYFLIFFILFSAFFLGFLAHGLFPRPPDYIYREYGGYTLRINARTSETHALTPNGWKLIAESPEKYPEWQKAPIVDDRYEYLPPLTSTNKP
jgi:hypothetical protein